MTGDQLSQRPEGKLLHDALQATGRSIRQVAAEAGMSDARWRQIVKGFMHVSGVQTESIAPPATLARMAQVVGVTSAQLRAVGREDAAEALEAIGTNTSKTRTTSGTKDQPVADAIDLIFQSTAMTATEKLEAIRKVLLLRKLAEADLQPGRRKGPEPRPITESDRL